MIAEFVKKQGSFTRFEFWAFTTLFVFVMFFFITDSLDGRSAIDNAPYRTYFEKAKVPFYYYENYFIPQLVHNIVLFGAFLCLNFIIIPRLVRRQSLAKHIILLLLVFMVAGVAFGVADTYIKGYLYASGGRDEVNQQIFRNSFEYAFILLFILGVYSVIKYTALHLLSKTDVITKRYPFMTREVIVATVIWLVMLLLLAVGEADSEMVLSWLILIPYGIAFYTLAFNRLIPRVLTKKRPLLSYLGRSAFLIILLFFIILLVLLALEISDGTAFSVSFFNMVFHLFITVPLTWVLYKRQQKGNEEVIVLKKELKQSTANIDFLRSQINPHFLFNALNTLYGTAIQENADRTSEGIQKLGDMMRFMLQENMQEKISLSREIDYLNNYIGLQRLRTDSNPIVQIQTQIEARETMLQIAPMLLIPFVENAFKHGISFREPSHIKVNLEVRDKTLYFDVYNSKHVRPLNDPEKDKSGVGLENVQQRLKLLYPNRHELIIRDTTREFFIHLTIQLA